MIAGMIRISGTKKIVQLNFNFIMPHSLIVSFPFFTRHRCQRLQKLCHGEGTEMSSQQLCLLIKQYLTK